MEAETEKTETKDEFVGPDREPRGYLTATKTGRPGKPHVRSNPLERCNMKLTAKKTNAMRFARKKGEATERKLKKNWTPHGRDCHLEREPTLRDKLTGCDRLKR